MTPFSDIHISLGSVATCLKRGGIFKHQFVASLLPSLLVKNFENRIIVGEVMGKSLVSCFFETECIYTEYMPTVWQYLLLIQATFSSSPNSTTLYEVNK